MKKATKIWLIVAASLILLGGCGFVGVMSWCRWDFRALNTTRYENNTHKVEKDFSNISVKTDTADLVFALAEDGVCRVECYESAKKRHEVTVENGTLLVRISDDRRWYDYIGIYWESPRITVYLPRVEYEAMTVRSSTGAVEIPEDFLFRSIEITLSTGHVRNCASVAETIKIKTSTGDVLMENLSAELVKVSVSTGRVTMSSVTCTSEIALGVSTGRAQLSDVTCGSLITTGDTGDLTLTRVVATDQITVQRSTGDVSLEQCDAEELLIKTDTGDVKGSLLSEKFFIAQTDTGRVEVPKTVGGGKCEITTDTGDIIIRVVNP